MTALYSTEPHLAARCLHLKMTMAPRPATGLLNLCMHIVREGSECVGPFLDDAETTCGLWEPATGNGTPDPLPAREHRRL